MNKQISGAKVEMNKLENSGLCATTIFWGEGFDSHAFMLEQILTRLEEDGYASRDEIMQEWKNILEVTK